MVAGSSSLLPYLTKGRVVVGFGRGGKQLGCPTANLDESTVDRLPSTFDCGVYYGWAKMDTPSCSSSVWPMVMSIGWNPQFKNTKKTMEVHMMQYTGGDFYDCQLSIIILGFIRKMAVYDSLEQLTQAIDEDKRIALEKLSQPENQSFRNHDFFSNSSSCSTSNTNNNDCTGATNDNRT